MPVLSGKAFMPDELQPIMVRKMTYKKLLALARKLDHTVPVVVEVLLESYLDDQPPEMYTKTPYAKEKKAIAKLKKLSTGNR